MFKYILLVVTEENLRLGHLDCKSSAITTRIKGLVNKETVELNTKI